MVMEQVLSSNRQIHFLPPCRHDHLILLAQLLDYPLNKIQSSSSKILIQGIVNQRLYKSPEELDEIERAVDIRGEMHLEAMKMVKAGIKEQHIASRLLEIATS